MPTEEQLRVVPEGKYADVGDGLKMHYHEAGPDSGRVLLWIHGSGPGASGYSNFKRNYPYFAERGYRCIVADTLGYGYSSMPEEGDYSSAYLAGKYKQLLEAAGAEKACVIGNSQGGNLSIQLALDFPETVERLVLMAPGGLEQREVYMQMEGIQAMMKSFFAKEGITREGMRSTFKLQLFDEKLITDEIIEERFQIAQTQPKSVIAKMKVAYLAERLKELSCPVFGLWGVEDKFCPVSGAMTVAREVKGAKVMLVNGCGHWVMVEHAALFNSLCLQFLAAAPGFEAAAGSGA
ncbi:MAG: alpha/beta fold hydrolase [Polyangiaceae bacterium]